MKKYTIIFTLLLLPINLYAQVIFNEIMYDVPGTDSKREWIEIYNSGDESIDLSDYILIESGKNHSINIIQGSSIINSKGYSVIASDADSFLVDHPNFSGNLFDSVLSLNNTGELLELSIEGVLGDSVTYNPEIGGKGDGSSLQFVEGVWIASKMTPGALNSNDPVEVIEEKEEADSNKEENISTHSYQTELTFEKENNIFSVGAGRYRSASINTPVEFHAISSSNEKYKYFWSFGDGASGKGEDVEHKYSYPGIYTLVLQGFDKNSRAISRTKIYITKPNIDILYINKGLEIKNNDSNEINVGKYIIKQGENKFVLAPDTIIESSTSVTIPSDLFGFDVDECKLIEITYPNGVLVKSIIPQDLPTDESVTESEKIINILSLKCSIQDKLDLLGETEAYSKSPLLY